MRFSYFSGIVLTALFLAACATIQPVTPGELFPGPFLDVRAPSSPGWILTPSNRQEMAFGRRDEATGITYAAQVIAFRLPANVTPDNLLSFVQTHWEEDSASDRFKTIERLAQFTSERSYPCVRLSSTVQDTKARTPDGTASLQLHARALYCQHPAQPTLGFMIGYSQRGGTRAADFESQADSFIAGVQVSQPRFIRGFGPP
jgi:hypothetical protein